MLSEALEGPSFGMMLYHFQNFKTKARRKGNVSDEDLADHFTYDIRGM